MNFALIYLPSRLWFRVRDFFHHWYVDASRAIAHEYISRLEAMDQNLALKVTFTHFFEPLYGDYSIVGRILGVIFRTGRIIIGSIVYLILSLIFAAIYIIWAGLPIYVLYHILRNR